MLGYFCKNLKSIKEKLLKYRFLIIESSIGLFSLIFILSYSDSELNKTIAISFAPIKGFDEVSVINISVRILASISWLIACLGLLI